MLSQKSRISQLNLLLQYCSFKGGIFKSGERICINQERAYLLSLNDENPIIIKVFEYNKLLACKIDLTLNKIEQLNWQPKELIPIDWELNDKYEKI